MSEKSDETTQEQFAKLEQMKKDYLDTFSTESGKKVLADLEKTCFVNKTTYSPEKGRILLNEGMRFVVVHIKNMMNFDLKELRKLSSKGE